ncbi:MAG: RNA polymerase sigma factor [Fimbriiglobus sp.]
MSLLTRLRTDATSADWHRWQQLYEPLLRGWAARAGVADADDVIQEVLLVLVQELPHFERQREGSFRAWLRQILVRRIHEHFRQRQRFPLASESVLAELSMPTSALSQLWDREHDLHLAKRLLALVEPDFQATTWQAFRLQVLDGQSAGQVAMTLGISVNAALLAKSRILKRLRDECQGLVEL